MFGGMYSSSSSNYIPVNLLTREEDEKSPSLMPPSLTGPEPSQSVFVASTETLLTWARPAG
eukprot:scaffold920_cov97-Skeletonema_menzelii.AAC.1